MTGLISCTLTMKFSLKSVSCWGLTWSNEKICSTDTLSKDWGNTTQIAFSDFFSRTLLWLSTAFFVLFFRMCVVCLCSCVFTYDCCKGCYIYWKSYPGLYYFTGTGKSKILILFCVYQTFFAENSWLVEHITDDNSLWVYHCTLTLIKKNRLTFIFNLKFEIH